MMRVARESMISGNLFFLNDPHPVWNRMFQEEFQNKLEQYIKQYLIRERWSELDVIKLKLCLKR
jgi:hypothetical protein